MTEKHTCCSKMFRGYGQIICGKGAEYEHEGGWYCGIHHPPTVEARQQARDDERHAKWEAREAGYKRQSAIVALKDRALQAMLAFAATQHNAVTRDDLADAADAIAAEYKELK